MSGNKTTKDHASITLVITLGSASVTTLKITQIGNSLGLVLPREVLAKLRVERGDEVYLSETPEGMRITAHNPEFAEQMKAARAIMKKRRNALRELAK